MISEEDTDRAKTSLRVMELYHRASEGLCSDVTNVEDGEKRKILWINRYICSEANQAFKKHFLIFPLFCHQGFLGFFFFFASVFVCFCFSD